jgi:sialate O-acetylesterase
MVRADFGLRNQYVSASESLFPSETGAKALSFLRKLPNMNPAKLFLTFVLCAVSHLAHGELSLHPLFSDHAVLQADLPLPVWGKAAAGAEVKVKFSGQEKTATADAEGRWQVVLDALKVSGEPAEMSVQSGAESASVGDLLVGEVWVCSGQSNMAMTVSRSIDLETTREEAATGKFAGVRLFKVPVAGADERQTTVNAKWTLSDAGTVPNFSAAGFFFGAALHRDLKVPVGLIQSANGGTNAYSWINEQTFREDPVGAPSREYYEAALAVYPAAKQKYDAALANWSEKARQARAEGKTLAQRAPRPPQGPDNPKRPTGHYNAMIAPLQPYAIRGAVWYQGEANSRPPFTTQYRDLMFALVEDWRKDWTLAVSAVDMEHREFPFYLVQLPNYAGGHEQGWPIIREQMFRFWKDGKNTGMVTTIDVGDADDIHPRDKKPVGERLARFARAHTYGADIVYHGPVYETMKVVDDSIVLSFGQVGGGLVASDKGPLKYFEIAGEERKFVPAQATIDGETVAVKGEGIEAPVAVRYAWSNNPEDPNFFNAEGLPASPFRTDDWEIEIPK